MKLFTTALAMLAAAAALAVSGRAGPYTVDLVTDPSVVPVGKAAATIRVTDASGGAVSGADVRVFAQMPGMPMGEREQKAAPVASVPGAYSATLVFGMAGAYDARVSVGNSTVTLPLETGKDTGQSTSFPWGTVGVIAIAIAAAGFVIARMRAMGQKLSLKGLGSFSTLGPIALLAICVIAVVWAVNHLRRPGAMTPMEAQVMEMDAAPPPGVLPVTMATVERGTVHRMVRYSGQAAGFVEQDVFPRVTGTLIDMPLYTGDRVRRGQVIGRLDISQLRPQVVQNEAMVEAAREGVAAATADYDASQAMVHQAISERGQFEAGIIEAQANLTAARENRSAMVEAVTSAQADVQDAEARQQAAQADSDYWVQELTRSSELLKAGAVSRDEYQKTVADAAKSRSGLAQSRQDVRSAQAKVRAAQAGVRQAEAGISAAKAKLAQATNEMHVHHAHVTSADAQAASARQKIAQARAGVRQSQAALAAAAASESYATLTAPFDGVVVARNVTPGSLVQPGTSVVRIAQISPIRLQANVPISDLDQIQAGAAVVVHVAGDLTVRARVTSVSPSVDAAARLGVVEAIVANPNGAFRPGQAISMQISIGGDAPSLVVPKGAVQSGPAGATVWIAVPDGAGFKAKEQHVETGDEDDRFIQIRSGLDEGQRVILSGFGNLAEGISVTASESLASIDGIPTVRITEAGFVPPQIKLNPVGPAKITFLRQTDNTCAKDVVFPALGLKVDLPLNRPVTIDLTGKTDKDLSFNCSMNMVKGQVVRP